MSNAPADTLENSIRSGYGRCGYCDPPATDILEQKDVVWCDENHVFHVSDECKDFAGQWSLLPMAEAREQGYTACTVCGADIYQTYGGGSASTVQNEQEPAANASAAEEAHEETEVSSSEGPFALLPQTVVLAQLKPAREATVYHTATGHWFHATHACQNMNNGLPYSLESAVADGFEWCPVCEPAKPEYMDEDVLWQDTEGVCHTTDECIGFIGSVTLVPYTDAFAQKLPACQLCHADQYLVDSPVVSASSLDN